MTAVHLLDIKKPLKHALSKAYDDYKKSDSRTFQNFFEQENNCTVVKKYSKQHPAIYPAVDTKYWHQLHFENESELSLFLLKWS